MRKCYECNGTGFTRSHNGYDLKCPICEGKGYINNTENKTSTDFTKDPTKLGFSGKYKTIDVDIEAAEKPSDIWTLKIFSKINNIEAEFLEIKNTQVKHTRLLESINYKLTQILKGDNKNE